MLHLVGLGVMVHGPGLRVVMDLLVHPDMLVLLFPVVHLLRSLLQFRLLTFDQVGGNDLLGDDGAVALGVRRISRIPDDDALIGQALRPLEGDHLVDLLDHCHRPRGGRGIRVRHRGNAAAFRRVRRRLADSHRKDYLVLPDPGQIHRTGVRMEIPHHVLVIGDIVRVIDIAGIQHDIVILHTEHDALKIRLIYGTEFLRGDRLRRRAARIMYQDIPAAA